jgi:hypothetical protein
MRFSFVFVQKVLRFKLYKRLMEEKGSVGIRPWSVVSGPLRVVRGQCVGHFIVGAALAAMNKTYCTAVRTGRILEQEMLSAE